MPEIEAKAESQERARYYALESVKDLARAAAHVARMSEALATTICALASAHDMAAIMEEADTTQWAVRRMQRTTITIGKILGSVIDETTTARVAAMDGE